MTRAVESLATPYGILRLGRPRADFGGGSVMADYALAVDVGVEVTAAISDDDGPRVVPIGDSDQLTMPAAVDSAGRLLVGDAAARWAGEPDLVWWKEQTGRLHACTG